MIDLASTGRLGERSGRPDLVPWLAVSVARGAAVLLLALVELFDRDLLSE